MEHRANMEEIRLDAAEAAQDNLPVIPLGVSDWGSLRAGNYLVVDKTAKLKKLVAFHSVFLSRPRRMGKSTLCSMLYELFAHGKERFKGTAIYDLWSEKTYPVIRLSFNKIKGFNSKDPSEFDQDLKIALVKAFQKAGFHEVLSFDQDERLSGFLENFTLIAQEHQLVFLIDEWDAPLSNSLDNEDAFNVFKGVLEVFYSWLREVPNLRFVFVTGIMRYRETSWFSGQDIKDISMVPYFADLLGYTKEDIKQSFKDYIPLAAQLKNVTEDELFEELTRYYNGFCFDYNASVKVYCPFAVNQFFSSLMLGEQPYMENYWMNSSNAPSALVFYLHGNTLEQDELKELCEQQFTLSCRQILEPSFFGTVKLKHLLVQAGYFSIKSIAENAVNPSERIFNCGVTNKDVDKEFVPVLTEYLVNFDEKKQKALEQEGKAAQQYLLQGDVERMCEMFNLSLDKVGKPILKNAEEVLYAFIFDQALRSHLIDTEREEINNLGRCDLVAITPEQVYVFELKRLPKTSSSEKARLALLDKADQQMLSKGYGNGRMYKGKPVTGIALVICDKYRQICAWRTIKKTEAGVERAEGFIPLLNIATQPQVPATKGSKSRKSATKAKKGGAKASKAGQKKRSKSKRQP